MRTLLLIATLLFSVPALCQTGSIDSMESHADELGQEFDDAVVPDFYKDKLAVPPAAAADTDALYLRRINDEIFRYTFNQNRKVFQWQYISSIIIFFVVILVVLMGLFLSYLQFRRSAESNTKLEIGSGGVKIDTAVIGLAILTLSLSFLFLYLKYVYPITLVKIH